MQVAERAGGPEDAANDATDAEEDDATLHVARDFVFAELLLARVFTKIAIATRGGSPRASKPIGRRIVPFGACGRCGSAR